MTIKDFFDENRGIAVALSGGVDSAYVLCEAASASCDVTAYFVRTAFQPDFEYKDAFELCQKLGVTLKVIDADVLSDPDIASNTEDRCYFCKKKMFTAICEAAAADGTAIVCDGTNASDDEASRPGMKALRELGVRSPLRECGLHKEDIRRAARAAGLAVWDKPSYACLATRIPVGTYIDASLLKRTEDAEACLRSFGFDDIRIRTVQDDGALVQVPSAQLPKLRDDRDEIVKELLRYYSSVSIDPEGR